MKRNVRLILLIVLAVLPAIPATLLAEDNRSGRPVTPAQPGDLVFRHRGETFGPFRTKWEDPFIAIPHVGIYVGNQGAYNTMHLKINQDKHGVIKAGDWQNEVDFKDPKFYSVTESYVPVSYQGKLMRMCDLPGDVKKKIREGVTDQAMKEMGRDYGKYEFHQFNRARRSRNCGDWALEVYDRVLRKEGVQVMVHKFPAPRTKDEWLRHPQDLKPGKMVAYAQLLGGTVDPSRLPKWTTSNDLPEKTATPNYWVTAGRQQSLSEANTAVSFAKDSRRALVVGDGREAYLMYQKTAQRLGADNVRWIRAHGSKVDWKSEARRFNADVVLGVKGSIKEPRRPALAQTALTPSIPPTPSRPAAMVRPTALKRTKPEAQSPTAGHPLASPLPRPPQAHIRPAPTQYPGGARPTATPGANRHRPEVVKPLQPNAVRPDPVKITPPLSPRPYPVSSPPMVNRAEPAAPPLTAPSASSFRPPPMPSFTPPVHAPIMPSFRPSLGPAMPPPIRFR